MTAHSRHDDHATVDQYSEHTSETARLIARLISGARMSSQLRGMGQVMRNINDGTSMLEVSTSSISLAASQSGIQDLDDASARAKPIRAQILQQAASAILTQANGQPNAVLALLR